MPVALLPPPQPGALAVDHCLAFVPVLFNGARRGSQEANEMVQWTISSDERRELGRAAGQTTAAKLRAARMAFRPHRHQLLGGRGMQRNGAVEILLGGAKAKRDGGGLHDLGRVVAEELRSARHVPRPAPSPASGFSVL